MSAMLDVRTAVTWVAALDSEAASGVVPWSAVLTSLTAAAMARRGSVMAVT